MESLVMNYPAKEGNQPARHQMLTSPKITAKEGDLLGPEKKAFFDKQAANLRGKPGRRWRRFPQKDGQHYIWLQDSAQNRVRVKSRRKCATLGQFVSTFVPD